MILFYFLEKDSWLIDGLIVKNQTTSTKEGYPLTDYSYSNKVLPLILLILSVLFVITLTILSF